MRSTCIWGTMFLFEMLTTLRNPLPLFLLEHTL
jgi:hypothetical protein